MELYVKIKYKIIDRRPGDVAIYYQQASIAKDELGLTAKLGIKETCEYICRLQSNNPNRFN